MKYDVVLTTYGTLLSDRKKLATYKKNLGMQPMISETDPDLANSVCLFHPNYSVFYRVVLDECQHIKNRKSQVALATVDLISQYRWCLSGTPMMNSVEELYSLYRYLEIKPYSDWSNFLGTFGVLFGKKGAPKPQAIKNLQALLETTLLRRTKTAQIGGKPILQLPEKTEEVVYAELDEDERKSYTDLEAMLRVQVNRYLQKGTIGKHCSRIMVMLLRLRQACCHPYLLLEADDAVPEVDNNMLERVKSLSLTVVQRLTEKSRALESADAINEGFECCICHEMMLDPIIPLPCCHGLCTGCLKQSKEDAKRGEDEVQTSCVVCCVPLDLSNIITYAAFKQVHMPEEASGGPKVSNKFSWVNEDEEDEGDNGQANAGGVGKQRDLKYFIVPDIYADISDDKDDSAISPEPILTKPKKKKKREGKKQVGIPPTKTTKNRPKRTLLQVLRKNAKNNTDAWRDYTEYLSHHWRASSKTIACMDILRKIQETGEKTIIFSQWTMVLDLLQVAIAQDSLNIKHCRYTGGMTMTQRNDTASAFSTDPSMKVMMVSLRAGNAGLNLVSASRVIIMDPFWNPYVEMQAMDRAHRIGQDKAVKVYRILTQGTVEDRIAKLQERKRVAVDAALDEREGVKLAALSLTELPFLLNLSADWRLS